MCIRIALILFSTIVLSQAFPQDLDYYDQYDDPAPPAVRQILRPQAPAKNTFPNHRSVLAQLSNGQCPDVFGTVYVGDHLQCDKYYECVDGVPNEKLCPDGMVFDSEKGSAGHVDPCDTPFKIDCTNRTKLQEPTHPSDFCPRLHGIFAHPDPTRCDVYYTCKNGGHTENICTTGTHFDEKMGICNWPSKANRGECVQKPAKTLGGFTCPSEEVINHQGVKIPHPTYANPEDCAKFFVCLNGVKPQEASCSLGKVYNERNGMCDPPTDVPECTNYYIDNPLFDVLYDDANGDGLRDFGDRSDFSQTSIN